MVRGVCGVRLGRRGGILLLSSREERFIGAMLSRGHLMCVWGLDSVGRSDAMDIGATYWIVSKCVFGALKAIFTVVLSSVRREGSFT